MVILALIPPTVVGLPQYIKKALEKYSLEILSRQEEEHAREIGGLELELLNVPKGLRVMAKTFRNIASGSKNHLEE